MYLYVINCLLLNKTLSNLSVPVAVLKLFSYQKNNFKNKLNMNRGDSLENYLLLPFTDYCGHAPLLPGHYGCVEALLTWGADVDMDIPHLGTALYTACICQELECAGKLLREGQFAAVFMFPNAEVT